MRNLFYLDSSVHSLISPEYINNPKKAEIIDRIYKYIPLNNVDYSSIKIFKRNLSDLASKDPLKETLNLCKDYWNKFENTSTTTMFHSFYEHTQDLPLQLIANFQKDILGQGSIYYNELPHLLVLSYYYDSHRNKINKQDLSELLGKKLAYKKGTPNNDKFLGNLRNIADKLYAIYKSFPTNPGSDSKTTFLSPFFEFNFDEKKKREIFLSSIYDTELFLGLILSSTKRKNPFIYFDTKNNQRPTPPTNLKSFLTNFNDITLNDKHRISILDENSLKRHLTEAHCDEKKLNIYNQFILERLSNINFINKLYSLSQLSIPDSTLKILEDFSLLPLLNTRIAILDFHKKYEKNLSFLSQEELLGWNTFLQNILRRHLTCTLPILNLIFSCLMSLSPTENSFCENYFLRNLDLKFFHFFNLDKKFVPTPKIAPFPINSLDPAYTKMTANIYDFFCSKTEFLQRHCNLELVLENMYQEQDQFFINEFLNYSWPMANQTNMHGISKCHR